MARVLGRHKQINGVLVEDTTAHRTSIDYITAYVKNICDENRSAHWDIIDFKYGSTSLSSASFLYCLGHQETKIILPGESTSLISEALGYGVFPIIYSHEVMTSTSQKYINLLVGNNYATDIMGDNIANTQEPIPRQEEIVIGAILDLI